MPRNRWQLPTEVDETIDTCALRFDGYCLLKMMRGDEEIDFSPWTEPVVKSLVFHEDETTNFATFFALQRWLRKWGGDMLPESAPEHTAFRFLFLHLYPLPVPDGFVFEKYETQWRRLDRETIEAHVATVRAALLAPKLADGFRGTSKSRER